MQKVHPDTYKPVLLPYYLKKVRSEVTVYELGETLLPAYILIWKKTPLKIFSELHLHNSNSTILF